MTTMNKAENALRFTVREKRENILQRYIDEKIIFDVIKCYVRGESHRTIINALKFELL